MSTQESRMDGAFYSTEVAAPATDPATQVQDGNPKDFGTWWREEGGETAESVARRTGASYHDAQDYAQEAALRTWLATKKGKADFSGEDSLLRYTCTTVHNYTISQHRRPRAKREQLVDNFTGELADTASSAEEVAVNNLNHQLAIGALKSAFDQMNSDQAAAFKATHAGNITRNEYAQQTGKSINTIATQTFRAKAKLRKHPELREALDLLDKAS